MAKKDVHLRIGRATYRGEMTQDTRKQYAVVTSGEESIEECLLIYAKDLMAAIDKYFWLKTSAIDREDETVLRKVLIEWGLEDLLIKTDEAAGVEPKLPSDQEMVNEWTKGVTLVGEDKAVWSGAPGESFTTIARLEDVEFPDPVRVRR